MTGWTLSLIHIYNEMEEELKQNTQQPKDGQSASPKHMSIRSILGGDILANDFFKRQTLSLIHISASTIFGKSLDCEPVLLIGIHKGAKPCKFINKSLTLSLIHI